jgi:autotransporter-associated beta strand protein
MQLRTSRKGRASSLLTAAVAATFIPLSASATPTVTTGSDSGGSYELVNNGTIQFKLYTSGSDAAKVTSIVYQNQQMVGTKGLYYDIQGTPNIYYGSGSTFTTQTGSNYVIITATNAATTAAPIQTAISWILRDGDAGFSTYETYHHTTAMADYSSSENRLGAEFFNDSLFHYSSIADNFWGYQAAGDADRNEGRFITGETSDMRGIPSEYIKNYETKYDWRTTYQNTSLVGIVTAANTSTATRPLIANNYGVWSILGPSAYESYNAGPTQPQTPVTDGASMIPSPAASHFGGPGLVYTGNMDKSFGPFFTYFNEGTDATINSLRADASKYTTQNTSSPYDLNNFYDTLNLPYYATSTQRGTVIGDIRTSDGTSMAGATVILSTFDPVAYSADPIGQEYQRRAAGYDYWINPNPDGTFNISGVRPGTYRVTVIKPGYYREGTFDNITVNANGTTNVGNLAWTPDISGKSVWQIGTFDRTAGEFRDGDNYNNWIDTFDETKEFPNGVNYTVNPANPLNDTANWSQNWPLNQINGTLDFFAINFTLASAPAANSNITLTVSIADQEFINDLGVLVYNAAGTSYNRVDAGFDHTADNAPATERSGDTSSQVLYRQLTIPASWLHAGSNKIVLHIVGGNLQWDALNLSIQNPGTFSISQWNGGNGNWSDGTQWQTQQYGYSNITKGTDGIANDTSTTFADGATATAPINSTSTTHYYDATINGGNVTLNTSPAVQKLSLLAGTVAVTTGSQTITANDAFAFAGATVTGHGTINALTTSLINLNNTISAGFIINSIGTVTWTDGANLAITGAGSKWSSPGFSFGQTNASNIALSSGAILSAANGTGGNGTLLIGTQGALVSDASSSISAANITNDGTLIAAGPVTLLTSSTFTNSGNATLGGTFSGGSVINTAGFLGLTGTSTYIDATLISGGAVEFTSTASIGGSGASVVVNSAGAVTFAPGITTPAFLARLSNTSTGALAITTADAATNLDFTTGPLAAFPNLSLGAVQDLTYTGTLTPANNTYRLGGGGANLTYSPAITGTASVIIGNTGSTGAVLLNPANSYTGTTTIRGGTLSLSSLPNGSLPSPIGQSSNANTNLLLDGGTLQYVGTTTAVTDRLFTLTQNGGTLDSSGAAPLLFTNSSLLLSSGTGNRNLTLTGSANGTFAPGIADPVSGITSLTLTGAATWTLGYGVKTYSGDTTVTTGTLQLSAGASLPSGAGKGNLIIALNGTMELNGISLTLNALNDGPPGAITTDNPTGWATPNGPGGGSLDNASNTTVSLTLGANNASGLFSGVISGNINLVKNGTGTQTLSGDNTYAGTTIISAGTLQIGVGGTPSSLGAGDGGFTGKLGAGTIINNATLLFDRGYFTTCSNLISGSGTLEQTANAELALGAANTYTGPTIIGQGIANIGLGGITDGTGLDYSGDCSLNASTLKNGGLASSIGQSSNLASNLILDGGTLYYSSTTATSTDRLFTVTQNGAAIYTSGGLTFSNTGALAMTGAGDRTLSLGGDSTTASTLAAAIGDPASGRTFLTKDRSATWTLTSTAGLTYSGDTTLLMGTLKVGPNVVLPFGTGKGNIVWGTSTDFDSAYPATLDMNGNNLNINALIGGLAAYSKMTNSGSLHTLTVGNANATGTFAGAVTGALAFTKTGTGIQTLNGANTYTGATTVSAGELDLGATGSLTSPTASVSHGATLVLLSGSVIPAATALTNNGTVSIANAIETLSTLNGSATDAVVKLTATNLTLSAGGIYAGSIVDNATAGALTVNSPFTLGTALVTTLNLNKNLKIQSTSKANTLNLTGASNAWTSGIDLAANKFILETTASTKSAALLQLQNQIAYGRTHADGIYSSIAPPANYALAVIDNATLVTPKTTFGGVAADTNSLLLSPELLGDSDLSGTVDLTDLTTVLSNLGTINPNWTHGNFDGASTIDLTDLNDVLNNLGLTNPNPSTPTPEPTSLALLAVPLLLTRRRHK